MSRTNDADLKAVFNESGVEIKRVYTAEDVEQSGGWSGIGSPGEFPFTRGIHKYMYRKRPWTMRQYAGFGTPEETNERFRYLIANGQTGLNVAFDLPTQVGLDSDDPMAEGEVGRVGMAVDTLKDFEIAFAGIDLDEITVSLTINGAAATLIAMYFAMAEKRGYDVRRLRGTAQNDILKEFIGRGTWIFPVEPSIKLVGDTILYCAENAPLYSPVSVCGYHIRESGANPMQEMAYGFCIAKAYIDHVLARGLSIDDFASRLSFNFDIHGNLFEQIAKFRAARRLWAKIIKDQYHAQNPRSMWLRMIAGGGGGGLTREQPENNIVRGAYYALISALSGTQTMALCSYDEAYTIPSEKAARISLRTMQILMEEMGLCDTVDPLGRLVLRRSIDQPDGGENPRDHGRSGRPGRHRTGDRRRSYPGRGLPAGLRALEAVGAGPGPQGRRELLSRRRGRAAGRIPPVQRGGLRCADPALGARPIRTGRSSSAIGPRRRPCRCKSRSQRHAERYRGVKAYATVGELTNCLVDAYGRYEEPVRF